MNCPECKEGKLYLLEWGTYTGSRSLDDQGNVIPNSYGEEGDDLDGIALECDYCTYSDPSIAVKEVDGVETIVYLHYSPMYDQVSEDKRFKS